MVGIMLSEDNNNVVSRLLASVYFMFRGGAAARPLQRSGCHLRCGHAMNGIFQTGNMVPGKLFCILCSAILLFSSVAYAAEPALFCQGVKSDNPAIQYELTMNALNGNTVVVIDAATKESCSCKFRHDSFFDQSRGMVPGFIVSMTYQSCDDQCPWRLKKQIKANISVTHRLHRGQTYSTPFTGDMISNCDGFSIDVPMLRSIEAQRIDALNQSPEFKAQLKSLKGVGDSQSGQGGAAQ